MGTQMYLGFDHACIKHHLFQRITLYKCVLSILTCVEDFHEFMCVHTLVLFTMHCDVLS